MHFGDDAAARALARRVDEFGADLVRDRPDRFESFALLSLPDVDGALAEAAYAQFNDGLDANEVVPEQRRFRFDLALSASPFAMPSLLAFADPARITFGSDFPSAPVEQGAAALDRLDLDDEQRAAIDRVDAEALFPRL